MALVSRNARWPCSPLLQESLEQAEPWRRNSFHSHPQHTMNRRAAGMTQLFAARQPTTDPRQIADKANQIVQDCARRFPTQPATSDIPELVPYCMDLRPGKPTQLPAKSAVGSVEYAKEMNELDKTEFPQACKAKTGPSGRELLWLRAHLRGKRWGDYPDDMFDALRSEDGHVVTYMTALDSDMTVDAQLRLRTQAYPQGRDPGTCTRSCNIESAGTCCFP